MKNLKQIILIAFISLVLTYIGHGQEINKEVSYNTDYYHNLDNQNFDNYLNYSVFKYQFNQIYGARTGVKISVVDYDQGFNTIGQHGYDMLFVGSKVRISDDVEFIPVDLMTIYNTNASSYLKPNTKVVNMEGLFDNTIFVNFVHTLQKMGLLVIQPAGNGNNCTNYAVDQVCHEFWKNNIHIDNFLVVGQIEVYPTPFIHVGNYPITDFSVYAGVYYDGTDGPGIGGTSAAAITVSTMIAQYYSIRPCWSYRDMKKFIYATLRPTSELGITNDKTKTKKYLKYDTRILDDSFVQSLGLSTCEDFNGFGSITQPVNNQDSSDDNLGIIGNTLIRITEMFGRLNNRRNNNATK